jgi:GMP synthase (glutamine-hydrolysing)
MSDEHDLVLVVDLGAQYAQLIARRVREAHVYSEIVKRSTPVEEMLARQPKAIILSGGPASVHVDGAPSVDPAIYESGVPVFGLCYGAQLVARDLGGEVTKTGRGEYGRTGLTVSEPGVLFREQPNDQVVWMSHFDTITEAPPGFRVLASTGDTPAAAFGDPERAIYGVQFHP